MTPFVEVMNAVRETFIARDLAAATGQAGLTIRFARNRYATNKERPALSIAFVEDGPTDNAQNLALGEKQRTLSLDLIVDLEVEEEAGAEAALEAGQDPATFDPTGLGELSAVLVEAVSMLQRAWRGDVNMADYPIAAYADWIEEIGIDDDEDLADIDGRLVARVNVLYRVHAEDPKMLLRRN